MRGRIEPVRHRQYLLRRTLPQGRKPTAREGLFVRLDDINARRRIYRWMHMCRSSTCHAHHLLLLLFTRFAYVSPYILQSPHIGPSDHVDDLANSLRGRPHVAELLGFGSAFSSNLLPRDKALAGMGRRSSPCGALSIAARPACMDAEVGGKDGANVFPGAEAPLVCD